MILRLSTRRARPTAADSGSIQKFFTHRSVSTLYRVSFQLTDELFLLEPPSSEGNVYRRAPRATLRAAPPTLEPLGENGVHAGLHRAHVRPRDVASARVRRPADPPRARRRPGEVRTTASPSAARVPSRPPSRRRKMKRQPSRRRRRRRRRRLPTSASSDEPRTSSRGRCRRASPGATPGPTPLRAVPYERTSGWS